MCGLRLRWFVVPSDIGYILTSSSGTNFGAFGSGGAAASAKFESPGRGAATNSTTLIFFDVKR
jgi:hypothetical protein